MHLAFNSVVCIVLICGGSRLSLPSFSIPCSTIILQHSILHRDVSIDNVMLVRNRVVRLCGFICDFDHGSQIDSSKLNWKGTHGTPFRGVTLKGTPLSKSERNRLKEYENELKERMVSHVRYIQPFYTHVPKCLRVRWSLWPWSS